MSWEVTNKLFKVRKASKCGTHFHVARFQGRHSIDDAQNIAYAVATREVRVVTHVVSLLFTTIHVSEQP